MRHQSAQPGADGVDGCPIPPKFGEHAIIARGGICWVVAG
jgi:hypothetical protein